MIPAAMYNPTPAVAVVCLMLILFGGGMVAALLVRKRRRPPTPFKCPKCGYDLRGSFIGSEGCFGVALDITVRLVPRPQIIRTMQEGKTRIDMKIGGQDVFIAPVPEKSNVNPPPVTPYQGLDHFGLRVKDIDKVVADLKAKGAEFTMELNSPRPGIKICFVRGPEGVSIEVLERGIK